MFENQVFVVDGPNGARFVGAGLHLPLELKGTDNDGELMVSDLGDQRVRYFKPHAEPNVGPNRVDFDDSRGHWQLRPLRDSDVEWAVQSHVRARIGRDMDLFHRYVRWHAGFADEPSDPLDDV